MHTNFKAIFDKKPVIGMIHLLPLPGSPNFGGSLRQIEDAAFEDLEALTDGGADAFLVENFSDIPYSLQLPLEAFAVMASVTSKLAAASRLPFGVNVQANQPLAEWALAYATGASFLRVEAFVENRAGSFGITQAAAPALMRQRAQYPCPSMVFADIHAKHTYEVVSGQTTTLCVREAIECGAAALIITGLLTGSNPSLAEVREMKRLAGNTPVLLGSGVSEENAAEFFAAADGAIIGSAFKYDGDVNRRVDPARVRRIVQRAAEGRNL